MNMLSDFLLTLTTSAEWIAVASLKTIPLIALVIILQRLFRKNLSAASRHLLWLSVLLSLSIPFGWTLNLGKITAHSPTETHLANEQGAISFDRQDLPVTSGQKTTENLISHDAPALLTANMDTHDALTSDTVITTLSKHYAIGLAALWLCGAVIFLGITLVRARYFHRIKTQASLASSDIFVLVNNCKRELGIQKKIQLLSTPEIQSPITIGWLNPAIILPHNSEQQLTTDTLKHILLHELGHIKRQDILFNWLACLINIVHWFNPVVWLACKRMRMDMEMACDALVLSHLDKSQRKSYGATLIEISEIPRVSPKALTTLGILENHTELKERLNMIKDFTTMNIKSSILFGVMLTATAITSLAQPNPSSNAPISNDKAAAPVEKVSNIKSEDYIDLKAFAKIAEKELKTKILVGQNDAQKIIQVNLGGEPLNYGQFLTQLKINEFTAYKSKDYIQIVQMRDARNLSIPIVEKGKTYYEDEVVTDYLRTEKSCAGKVLAAVRPLVPQYAHLSSYDDEHTLIIIDTYSNIQRIKGVINSIEANLTAPQDCKSMRPIENRPNKQPEK